MATTTPWWVPVAGVADLRAAPPWAARAFGEDLVLWRAADAASNHAGPPSVFVDRCPHRGARLSRGRVDTDTGTLECPYHGWRFEQGGRCLAIPALPGFTPPATHRACAWQAMEAHGLVWVAAPGAPHEAPHEAPNEAPHEAPHGPDALHGLPARRVLCGPFDVAASAPRVVENFLDTAHFGFVHEGWLGARDHVEVPAYEVKPDALGRPGVPHYRAWQPQASSAASGGAWIDYRYQLLSPLSALLRKQAQQGDTDEAYVLWTSPTGRDSCRAWFTIATSDEGADAEVLRQFQQTIFAQDRPVLESQRPRELPVSGGEVHSAADRFSAAYRRWLREIGFEHGCC